MGLGPYDGESKYFRGGNEDYGDNFNSDDYDNWESYLDDLDNGNPMGLGPYDDDEDYGDNFNPDDYDNWESYLDAPESVYQERDEDYGDNFNPDDYDNWESYLDAPDYDNWESYLDAPDYDNRKIYLDFPDPVYYDNQESYIDAPDPATVFLNAPDSVLLTPPQWVVPVKGVTYENRQQWVSRMQSGQRVILIRDPTNPYDQNAIKVCNEWGQQLGFVPKEYAAILAPQMDRGESVAAKVIAVVGGKAGKFYGLRIAIFNAAEAERQQRAAEAAKASDCFIATAAFGSPMAPEVARLRIYRDQRLIRYATGRAIAAVYSRYLPLVAQWIAHRPWARTIIRRCLLWPLLAILPKPIPRSK